MKKLNDPLAWIGEETQATIEIKEIEIDKIIVKEQIRTKSNVTENIEELAESIKRFGINQNLLVCEIGTEYILIAGERRLEAAKMAGLKTVPCSVKSIAESDIWKYQLIENIHRKDLDPIELANLYKKLKDAGMSIRDIAGEIKRSKSHVQEILQLLALPDEVKEKVSAERTVKKAVEIAKVKDKETQDELIKNYSKITADDVKKVRKKSEEKKHENITAYEAKASKINDSIEEKIAEFNDSHINIQLRLEDGIIEDFISEAVLTVYCRKKSALQDIIKIFSEIFAV